MTDLDTIREDVAARDTVPNYLRVYVDDDGCISEPIEQWADGSDRLPNHHNNWHRIWPNHEAALLAEVDRLRAENRELHTEREEWRGMARIEVADRLGTLRAAIEKVRAVPVALTMTSMPVPPGGNPSPFKGGEYLHRDAVLKALDGV